MNIVLIVIDTLRYDYIGAMGNDWIQTPNMDKLAARSWRFHKHIAASYPTIPHRTDVLTGEYGAPFHPWRPLRHNRQTFPELLAEAGYCTQLLHDTPHLVNGGHNFDWPFHAWDFIRGAEVDRPWLTDDRPYPENWAPDPVFAPATWEMIEHERVPITYARANGQRDRLVDWHTAQLFTTAAQWIRDNEGRSNAFLWLDCFDPHEPWDVPPEYMRLYDTTPGYDGTIDPVSFVVRNEPWLTDAARKRIAAAYAAKVTWVDHWLGHFLDVLYGSALGRETAVILTADHGTNVGELNKFGKGNPPREPEAHTPLFVSMPDGRSGDCDAICQPQDIAPTILAMAGVKKPASMSGQDMLAVARNKAQAKREIAMTGRGIDFWCDEPDGVLLTVSDGEWYLEMALRPQDSILRKAGSMDPITAENMDVALALREAALAELENRGIDAGLLHWLASQGEEPYPEDATYWEGWPGPSGFYPYYERLYVSWH